MGELDLGANGGIPTTSKWANNGSNNFNGITGNTYKVEDIDPSIKMPSYYSGSSLLTEGIKSYTPNFGINNIGGFETSGLSGGDSSKGIMSGLTDWFGQKGNVNMLNTGLGVAGIGMGLANYFAQKPLLDQQVKGAKLQNQAAQTQLAEHNKFMGQIDNLTLNRV